MVSEVSNRYVAHAHGGNVSRVRQVSNRLRQGDPGRAARMRGRHLERVLEVRERERGGVGEARCSKILLREGPEPLVIVVRGLETASPTGREGRFLVARQLSQSIFDQRGQGHASSPCVTLRPWKELLVDRDGQFLLHRRGHGYVFMRSVYIPHH